MKLSDYNEKCVRITLKDCSVFEGACLHDPEEFCEFEMGVNEECLEIAGWLFKKSEIEKVELIDGENPYLAPFDIIEEEKIKEGADEIFDFFIDEDPRNIERLLCCIEDNFKKEDSGIIPDKGALIEALKKAFEYVSDDGIKEKIRIILSDSE